ncbi:helix-turn-helix domain-containing protein [Paraburkholderia sp. A1RI-2L]|uniref:helix-turn-helix domain-containing protein n=1 Tax=Paraburkholderia sp. A1RI-2L TaxID=3028367 RepID=UPI003B9F8963
MPTRSFASDTRGWARLLAEHAAHDPVTPALFELRAPATRSAAPATPRASTSPARHAESGAWIVLRLNRHRHICARLPACKHVWWLGFCPERDSLNRLLLLVFHDAEHGSLCRAKDLREARKTHADATLRTDRRERAPVYRWERGIVPQLDTLIKLADALNVTLDELSGRAVTASEPTVHNWLARAAKGSGCLAR